MTGPPVFLRALDPEAPPQCPSCGHRFDLTNPADPVVINFGAYLACSCGELAEPEHFGIEVGRSGPEVGRSRPEVRRSGGEAGATLRNVAQ